MRQLHDPNSDDLEERALHDLQNLCDTLQEVVQRAPDLAPGLGTAMSIYHELLHGELRREVGYDADRLLEIVAALSNGYRNALFMLSFAHRDAQKFQLKGLDERRVRNLLADILETQIDGNLDLDRIREIKAEARALITGDDGDAPLGH